VTAGLEAVVSPYTGIVRGLVTFARATDESTLVAVGAVVADRLDPRDDRPTGTSGASHWDPAAARAAAIGESVERYSAAYLPVEELVTATAAELGPEAVAPETFALFHAGQYDAPAFPFRPFTRSTRVRWARGRSLATGEPVWLPAQLVYLPIVGPGDEQLIGYATSSGVACAATEAVAVATALYELIERDAFMLAWTNRLSLPLLEWRSDPVLRRLDDRYFARTGLRHSAVDLSAFFGVPAVLGVVHGLPNRLGALGVGAGCARTVETAWRKAFSEAFDVHCHVRDALVAQPELAAQPANEIGSFDDHIFFYGSPERARAAAFLDASPDRRSTADVAPLPASGADAEVGELVARLADRGVDAYAVDVTAPDVREAGLCVVRVVCPQLCALDVVDRARFLGGSRLYRASFDAGLVERPLELGDLNRDPHPFP
jgi:ribosomal protein S12 methylthiotransferase accessory factor